MATTSAKPDVVVHDGHNPDADRAKQYVLVAIVLAVVTGSEVAASYATGIDRKIVFAALMVMMVFKFATVTLFFMHLKFDKRFLTVVFYSGLLLAVMVYLAVLTAFRFWTPEHHMVSGLLSLI